MPHRHQALDVNPAVHGIVALLLVGVFVQLALLHVFWAVGGRWGSAVAVPEIDGRPAFVPGRAATLMVAGLLVLAGATIALRSRIVALDGVPPRLVAVATWTLASVFALRAAGNLHTFGFFKTVRATRFARLDTRVFSPLCLAIALGCTIVAAA
jgi:hypothetical protein